MITIYSPTHREVRSSNLAWRKVRQFGYKLELETERWAFKNIPSQSGTISFKSIWAGDLLVKDLYQYNLRSSIQYLLTYSGDQLAAALCPIIYDIGSSAATNVNFVAGDFAELTGLGRNPNTTKYITSGFTDAQLGSANSYSATTVFGTTIATADVTESFYGTLGSAASQNFRATRSAGDAAGRLLGALGGTNTVILTGQSAKKVCTFSRTSTTSLKSYLDGDLVNTTVTSTTSTPAGVNFIIFGRNNGGTPAGSDVEKHLVDAFGYGLDDTKAANLATALNAFTTRIGR